MTYFRGIIHCLGASVRGSIGGAAIGAVCGATLVFAVRNFGVQGGGIVSDTFAVGSVIGALYGLAVGACYGLLSVAVFSE